MASVGPTAVPAISADVPLIIGTNHDDATTFLVGDPKFGTLTHDEGLGRVEAMYPGHGAALLAAYQKNGT